jgi:hypothetical protein
VAGAAPPSPPSPGPGVWAMSRFIRVYHHFTPHKPVKAPAEGVVFLAHTRSQKAMEERGRGRSCRLKSPRSGGVGDVELLSGLPPCRVIQTTLPLRNSAEAPAGGAVLQRIR